MPVSSSLLKGKNALGRLLMELREKVKSGQINSESLIYPLNISAFLLFDHPIKEIHSEDYFIKDLDDIYAY
ncbi:hypothetical protein D9M68_748940 [compost metagenome]